MFNFFRRKAEGKQIGKRGRDEGLLFTEYGNSEVFRKSLIIFLTASVVFLTIFVFMKTVSLFLLVFAGILFAETVTIMSGALTSKTGLSRRSSVAVTLSVLLISAASSIYFFDTGGGGGLRSVSDLLSGSITAVSSLLEEFPGGAYLLNGIGDYLTLYAAGKMWPRPGWVFTSPVGVPAVLFLIVLIGAYLAFDPEKYVSGSLYLIPPGYRRRAGEIFRQMGAILRTWLIARLFSMVFIAVTVWITLVIFGRPSALAVALLAGLVMFIPYFGAMFAAIPILAPAFAENPMTAFLLSVIYLGMQLLNSRVLLPLIHRKAAGIPAVLAILSQLLFGTLFGLPGVILAAPLTAAGMVAVRMVYVEDVLGGRSMISDEL